MRQFKVVVEQHADGFIAYPLGFRGAVVGEGETAAEAVADVASAIRFSLETFGREAIEDDLPLLDAFMTEVSVAVDAQVPG
jgi:predicted RNase H-like HicB family nuclease